MRGGGIFEKKICFIFEDIAIVKDEIMNFYFEFGTAKYLSL